MAARRRVPAQAFCRVPLPLQGVIRVFNVWPALRGTCVKTWITERYVNGIAISRSGDVVVTDHNNHCVHVIALDGTRRCTWGSGRQVCTPTGVAVAPTGDVVVTDHFNHRVQVFRSDGTFVRKWGSRGDGYGQFMWPSGVAVSQDCKVVVSDVRRVQVFRLSDGAFLWQWGTRGSARGELDNPYAICMSPSGEVSHVSTAVETHTCPQVLVCDTNNHRVQVFTLTGTYLRQWGSRGTNDGEFRNPWAIAVRGDQVLVSDHHNYRVQVFRLDGTFVGKWGSYGWSSGQFQYPAGLAVTRTGQVFVCDSGSTRIQVFE